MISEIVSCSFSKLALITAAIASVFCINLDASEIESSRENEAVTEMREGERSLVNSRGTSLAMLISAQELRAERIKGLKEESKKGEESKEEIENTDKFNETASSGGVGYDFIVDPLSYYPNARHFATGYSIFAGWIEIEDGSVWSIAPGDTYKIGNWLYTDLLSIQPNIFSPYQFIIRNENTGIEVQVNLQIGPFVNGIYTNRIVYVDKLFDEVKLQDGSYWDISPWDDGTFANWFRNDAIIVGINNGIDSWTYPFILINVATNSYVCARLSGH